MNRFMEFFSNSWSLSQVGLLVQAILPSEYSIQCSHKLDNTHLNITSILPRQCWVWRSFTQIETISSSFERHHNWKPIRSLGGLDFGWCWFKGKSLLLFLGCLPGGNNIALTESWTPVTSSRTYHNLERCLGQVEQPFAVSRSLLITCLMALQSELIVKSSRHDLPIVMDFHRCARRWLLHSPFEMTTVDKSIGCAVEFMRVVREYDKSNGGHFVQTS